MILIISNETDGHVGPVTAELGRRGDEFAVFDPALYPQSATLAIDGSTSAPRATLSWDGRQVDMDQITAVWYRRPGEFRLSDRLQPGEASWLRTECSHLFRALWSAVPGPWVSSPDAVRQASLKLLQLRVARTMGFTVPRFVVTNDADHAKSFISSCPSGAVVKVLANPGIVSDGRAGALYTHLVTAEDMDQIESVRFGPTFLQEFTEKQLDIRVTVIGGHVFAVGIRPDLPQARIDFRRAEVYDLPHTVMQLPDRVSDLCRGLVERLGLRFGAIDLLLTPGNDYVFLEINPNGQWYWLEEITGMPMCTTMCDLLTGRR